MKGIVLFGGFHATLHFSLKTHQQCSRFLTVNVSVCVDCVDEPSDFSSSSFSGQIMFFFSSTNSALCLLLHVSWLLNIDVVAGASLETSLERDYFPLFGGLCCFDKSVGHC